ncbi:conserved exported protein of unknown function [Rhodovastum atsumiense]|uniref:Entericidin A/B family lipoprotein n=1 Tax=Rhodovastum atsumiense TaxID=504468 RepID=A0A5M6IRT2_9PROT|nr:hypothetical protein [Rhodovastum atsumiense]KAA5610901.1 hypothetical protein F1189_16800 [Rhodovastum atsumiense]CAH2601534.1 conserved exported protein of unknown function [Rhodovastum atsumiense]
MRRTTLTALTAVLLVTLMLPLAACQSEGPAERTGKSLDQAGQNLRDTVDPPSGPAEAAGRKLDRTFQ